MTSPRFIADEIVAARGGSADALGTLLEHCRDYLLLIANATLDEGLRGKIGASDVVQETFLDAHRAFHQFEGRTEQDLLTWLRQILLNNLRDVGRRHQAAKRQPLRDVGCVIGESADRVRLNRGAMPPADRLAADSEERERLRRAIQRLSPDYCQVVTLRSLELRPFDEIGRVMDRSADAARKLWSRAIQELARVLESGA